MFRDLFNPLSWFRRGGGEQDSEPHGGKASGTDSADAAASRSPLSLDTSVKTYSRRMMPPFTGQLQVAETGDARALSIDGRHWEIQFRYTDTAASTRSNQSSPDKRSSKYTPVASITPAGLEQPPLHPFFDTEAVSRAIDLLFVRITNSSLPYPAIDRFEYWLLDQSEGKPLALLYSCISAEEIGAPSARPTWMAMPAAQLPIEEPTDHRTSYVPPVNARLESLIAEHAGPSPRAAWFDRAETTTTEFPPCLISEDWEQEEHDRLCQLYICRLAPRLLMLQGLAHEDRQRLEQACRENALDVDRFHRLYPEFTDQKLLKALRVEARLRRSAEPVAS